MLNWLDLYSMSWADLVNHVHNISVLQLLLTHSRMTMPPVCVAGEKLSLDMWPNTMNSFNFPNLIWVCSSYILDQRKFDQNFPFGSKIRDNTKQTKMKVQ